MRVKEFSCGKHTHQDTGVNMVLRFESHEDVCPYCTLLAKDTTGLSDDEKVIALGAQVEDVEAKMETLEDEITSHQAAHAEHGSQVEELETEIDQLKADLYDRDNVIKTHLVNISEIKTGVEELVTFVRSTQDVRQAQDGTNATKEGEAPDGA